MTGRCFVCAARMWGATDRTLVFASGRRRRYRFACGSCGVLAEAPEDGEDCRSHLDARLGGGTFLSDENAPYGLDLYSLRSAATRRRLAVEPLDADAAAALRRPPGERAAAARLAPLEPGGVARVSLGIACRPADCGAVLSSLAAHRGWASGIVVLVDADVAPATAPPGVRVVARPLKGDFAEQRNALQDLSTDPWMLQLDADETLDADTAALLPALARMADRDGAVSIGLARRNHVDGVLSDLFPDTQYRLNRRAVRYRGRVHERPERPWEQSFIALHGAIDHHLDRARVLTRSQGYEAMAPGRGRLEEARALLEPYRD